MTEIRSLQNPRLKALRKLHTKRGRAQSGHFLAEGEDLVATAKAAGRRAVEGYRASGTEIGGRGFPGGEAAARGDRASPRSGAPGLRGLPQPFGRACGRHARIPSAGAWLNAAMAATVALYEMTRDEGTPVGNRSSRVPAS